MMYCPELPVFYKPKSCDTEPEIDILDITSYRDSRKTSTASPNLDYSYARDQRGKKAFAGNTL